MANRNPYLFINKQVQFGKFFVSVDIRLLKSQATEAETQKNFNWFQQPQEQEFVALLGGVLASELPNLMSASVVKYKTQQTPIGFVTGTFIRVAYCIGENNISPKCILQAIVKKKDIRFSELEHLPNKLVISVRRVKTAHQEVAPKVSHYFNVERIDGQSSDVENKLSANTASEEESRTPKVQRALKDVVLADEKRVSVNGKRSNLRMPKLKIEPAAAVAALEVGGLESNVETVDLVCDSPTDNLAWSTQSKEFLASSVKDLSLECLDVMFRRHRQGLADIYKERVHCRRHEDFYRGGLKKRLGLDFQVNIGCFTSRQVNHIINHIKEMFSPHELKMLDYVLKVLLPEFLAKIIMQKMNVSYEVAERKLMDRPANAE